MRKYFIPTFLLFLVFLLPYVAEAATTIPPVIGFSSANSQVDESGKLIRLKVERLNNGVSVPAVSVDYRSLVGETATNGDDYANANGKLSWGKGDTEPKYISISIVDDSIVEPEESLVIVLLNCEETSSSESSCDISRKTHKVTIIDNDFVQPGEFVLERVNVTEDEGGVARITVNRINGADGAVSVDYRTVDGSAFGGSDFTARSGTLSWGDQEEGIKTFDIPILKDSEVESQESFKVELFNASNNAIIEVGKATVNINDATEPGILSFTNTVISTVKEGDKATITVTRTDGVDGAVSVGYKTNGGTATAGSDYIATSGVLSWADQEGGSKAFEISVLRDSDVESPEFIKLLLINASNGAEIGGVGEAAIKIEDSTGHLSFTSKTISAKEGDIVEITVARNNGTDGAISVDYQTGGGTATAGVDYTTTSGTLTWNNQEGGSKTIKIPVLKDIEVESQESFKVRLTDANNNEVLIDTATVNVNDSTQPGDLSFTSTVISTKEGDIAQIEVARNNGTDGAISVDYQTIDKSASAGSDYKAISGAFSWSDKEGGSKTINVPILKDLIDEPVEAFEVKLSDATNGATIQKDIAEVSINDTTELGELVFESTIITAEEGDTARITVSRINGADGAVSVSYQTADDSATAGSDYTAASGTLSWSDQESGSKSFEVKVLTDTQSDASEIFSIRLSDATAGVIINDNIAKVNIIDAAALGNLVIDTPSVSVNEGDEAQITVTRENGVDGILSLNYQTENVSALAGEDYILSSGSLTWADQEGGSKTINIVTNNDANVESVETFKITFDAEIDVPVIVSIDNQLSPGIITLTKNTVSIEEGSFLEVEILRQGGVDGEISVDYATETIISETGNSAVPGVDYTPVSGTLNWSQGDNTTKIVRVPIEKDFTVDGSESFLFALSNVQGTKLGDFQNMTVTIENTQSTLEELPGLSPEQKQMAQMLTGACVGAFGDLLDRCAEILQGDFDDAELKDILQQLLPTEVGSMGSTGIKLGTTQLKNLMQRLSGLRRGQRGFSADGLTFNIQGESLPVGRILTSASEPLGGGASSDIQENEKFGFFIHGKINVGDKDQTDRETGFEFSTQGVTVGMDYRFNDELVMGAAFGYGHTNTRYDQSRGEMDANAISASFYGSYYLPESFYVDWVLAYGFHDYEVDRNIHYDEADYAASSTPEGNQYDVAVSFGKDVNWQQWQLSSYARMEYQVMDIESYQESGGHGFALRIGEQAVNSFTTVLGGQLVFNWSQSWGVLSPAARFEWEHQYMDSSRNITASFVNSGTNGGALSIATENTDRNYFNVGASLNATFDYGRSAFVLYETRLGQNDISSHMIEIGVRIPF